MWLSHAMAGTVDYGWLIKLTFEQGWLKSQCFMNLKRMKRFKGFSGVKYL